jgi:prepilin-type N-terminal cleavage/methylation domain-containing protein
MLIKKQIGFSLAEMAVVLVIMGILLASGLGALQSQMSNQRFRESKQLLERAKEALLGFAVAYGRLPCPANAVGLEARNPAAAPSLCVAAYGDLPWQTLGLPQLDAWGRPLKYRVATFPTGAPPTGVGDYARDTVTCGSPTTKPCVTLSQAGNLQVCNDAACTANQVLVSTAVAVIFSEGENGTGTGAQENSNRDGNTTFVQSGPSGGFDDILIWIPTTIFNYRLTAAGRLP